MLSIASNPVFGTDNCQRCQAALEVGKFLALAAPEQGPALAVRLCDHFGFNSNCAAEFGINALGGVVTQVVANADVGGLDGQVGILLAFSVRLASERARRSAVCELTRMSRCCAKSSLGGSARSRPPRL